MLVIRQARVPAAVLPVGMLEGASLDSLEPWLQVDIEIVDGVFSRIGPSLAAAPGARVIDADRRIVLPGLIDAHVHLDKTHTWDRAPNRSATFAEALSTLARDKAHWTEEDLFRRASFGLRCAYAHGTRLIRTHVDTGLPWAEVSHAVMAELRRQWKGVIALQTVPLCPGADWLGPHGPALADLALKHGASALGGFLLPGPELPAQIGRLLELAEERGVGIDLHVDENGDPAAEVLRAVATGVLRAEFRRPVTCGHCCSLAVQAPDRVRSTVALVREAGIGVIALPDCNLYLQGRRTGGYPRSPVWRGLTLINDLCDAGVPVACASDNVHDAFHRYGDYDMLQVWALAVRLGHLDERLSESVEMVTRTPAVLAGRADLGRIEPGLPASLVLLPGRSLSEALSRPAAPRSRLDGETLASPEPPAWTQAADGPPAMARVLPPS